MGSASRCSGSHSPEGRCACGGGRDWRLELSDESVALTAQLPGIGAADVDVFLDEQALSVAFSAPGERLDADEGRVRLLALLPVEVDGDVARAELRGGVLRVTLSRLHRSSSRRIPVVSTDGGGDAPAATKEKTA